MKCSMLNRRLNGKSNGITWALRLISMDFHQHSKFDFTYLDTSMIYQWIHISILFHAR